MGGHASPALDQLVISMMNGGVILIFISIICSRPQSVHGVKCYECTTTTEGFDDPGVNCTMVNPSKIVDCGQYHCVTRTIEYSNGSQVTSRGCSSCIVRRESLIPFIDRTVGCPDNKCVLSIKTSNTNTNTSNTSSSKGELNNGSSKGPVTVTYNEFVCGCAYDLCNVNADCLCHPLPWSSNNAYYCFLIIFPACSLLLGLAFKYSDGCGRCLRAVTCRDEKVHENEYTLVKGENVNRPLLQPSSNKK